METTIIDGNIKELVENYINDKSKLPRDLRNVPIEDWDVSRVTDMSNLFLGCESFNQSLNDWDVSNVTNMMGMFEWCESFNQPLNDWNVSNVTDMSNMFEGCRSFNQPLNDWNVSNVTNMMGMFGWCEMLNQPLNDWNVSNVTDMSNMFGGCRSFNQPLNDWNVSNVTNMMKMFECINFNQPLNDWNVSNVTNMMEMFEWCESFNQPLNNWDVSNVTDMTSMFSGCISFNQSLNDWNVSNVTNMMGMFEFCESFNQPLNDWNVSNVTDMTSMFSGCRSFNQPLNNWDVSNVTDMGNTFLGCESFNQPLNDWDVSNVIDMNGMFDRCGISEENKPTMPQRRTVDPMQVHREASKINYDKLNTFLKESLDNIIIPMNLNYSQFINQSISTLISETGNTEETKTQQTSDFGRIMSERLNGLNYTQQSQSVRESIFYTLSYVLSQPTEFKELYLQTFLQDCIHAYEGSNGMTCANGALERIIFSLVPACATDEEKEDYKKIIGIITANPQVLIIEYIKDWYKLHKTGTDTAFPDGTTEEQKKQDLKRFLLQKLPNENVLIDQKISEYADNIGYEPDDFAYGGKRKTRKIRKTKKNNKTKKNRKTKTNRKRTNKVRKTNRKKGTKNIKRK